MAEVERARRLEGYRATTRRLGDLSPTPPNVREDSMWIPADWGMSDECWARLTTDEQICELCDVPLALKTYHFLRSVPDLSAFGFDEMDGLEDVDPREWPLASLLAQAGVDDEAARDFLAP